MPSVVLSTITFLANVALGATAGAAAALGYYGAAALGAVIVAGGARLAVQLSMPNLDIPVADNAQTRQTTVRSTVEPMKLIYGEALVSGPITFVGTAGTDNRDLYHQIALAGHEVEDISDIYFDDEVISDSQINSGSSSGGNVTSGTFAPLNSTTILKINKHRGTSTQSADADLVSAFTQYTSAHTGKGIANIVVKMTMTDEAQKLWDQRQPNNIKGLVKGKKDIYDPRLDTSAGANPTSSSYQAWTDNPALCVADYLLDTRFGLGIAPTKINWSAVVTAADACDDTVSIPGSTTEKRFTANGVLFATNSHRNNLDMLLSAMNGSLAYSSGQYTIRAGVYEAPTHTLTEDDLTGPIGIRTSVERSERFNKVSGVYVSPQENHKSMEFPAVQLSSALARDNNETLTKNIKLPMTNSSYMAQRIANKMIQLSDDQKLLSFPCNMKGLKIAIGDRVQITVSDLSYSNKVFRCAGWSFADDSANGVNLTLVEENSSSYADPTVSEYSTETSAGVIQPGFPGVPDPQNLSATAGLKNIELNWTNPANTSKFKEIVVYASPNSSWSSKVEIGRTMGTQFIHDASTAADPISAGTQRYYWVRALNYGSGTGAGVESDRNPDSDTSSVVAVCGRVNWSDVSGTTGAPADSATVGATFGTNVDDGSGNTVDFSSVDNSVVTQDILRVEVEAGQVLDLETGIDVDIQNLGDVAIYVSGNSALLQGNIDTVQNSLTNLEGTVVDLTSGVSDVYVKPSAPVAGADGIPNPIPDFSRWYDSSNNNAPYYWSGAAWVSLEDPRIATNANNITSISTSLNTTNTNVTTAQTTADSKIVALFQDNEPSTSSRTTGDLWFDTNDSNKLYRFDGSAWTNARDTGIQQAITDAANAQAAADSKIESFYQDNEPTSTQSSSGDLWFDTNDGNKAYRYNGSSWQLARDGGIATAISDASNAQATADGRVTTFFTTSTPTANAVGDLWFDTDDKNKLYRWSGSAWVAARDTDIAQAITDAANAQTTADGKIVSFIQDDAPTSASNGDLWIDSNDNNKLYRFNGSAWVAVRDSGIQANADAITVLDTTVTNIDGTVTAISASNTSLVSKFNVLENIQDESAANLQTEANANVEIEELSTAVAGLASADQTLQTRVTATETTNSNQAIEITSLSSSLETVTTQTSANADAVESLSTSVTQINTLDGTSTSANATKLVSLSATVEDPTTGVAATAGTLGTLTANVSDGSAIVFDMQTLFASVGATQTDNYDATRSYAAGDGVVSSGIPYIALQATTGNTPASSPAFWSELKTAAALITENNSARIGYCLDSNGDLTDHKNATVCQAAGNTWYSDTALAQAIKALRVVKPDGTSAVIQDATQVISNDVGDVIAQKFIKVDSNGRISGYGLKSTTSSGETESDFVVIADKFSVVNPDSTSDTPLVPFSISLGKIQMNSDVEINGNLVVGTIDANRISIDGTFLSVDSSGQLTVTGAPGAVTTEGFTTTSATGQYGTNSGSISISSTQRLKVTYDVNVQGSPTFGQSTNFPVTMTVQKSVDGANTFSTVKTVTFNPTSGNNVDVVTGFFSPAPTSGEIGIFYLNADGTFLLSGPSSGTETAIFRVKVNLNTSSGINSVAVTCLTEVF